jgi:hypothetical protein
MEEPIYKRCCYCETKWHSGGFMYLQAYNRFGRDRMSDLSNIIKDMSKQRKVQCVMAIIAVFGAILWLMDITVLNINPGEFIAALAIILFAVATIKRVDDEEVLEEGQEL